tara:strand:+ start:861 stop:1760 length:900 start_codon:yes stop_codon:yes gene_type:complete
MFDTVIVIDWSARSAPSSIKPCRDAIYLCISRLVEGTSRHPEYHRTRTSVMDRLRDILDRELVAGRRTLVGFDFSFGYPVGFAKVLTGKAWGLAVWDWLAERLEDDEHNSNNRFEIAAQINNMFPGVGPFWGAPAGISYAGLPHKGTLRTGHGMIELRETESASKTAQSSWKLFTTGSVGSQALLGLMHLAELRKFLGLRCQIFPQETGRDLPSAPIVLCEIYPSYYKVEYAVPLEIKYPDALYHILDARQVRETCDSFASLMQNTQFDQYPFVPPDVGLATLNEEGWIMGVQATDGRT